MARGLREYGFVVTVATFYHQGYFEGSLECAGITVTSLGKRGRWDFISFLSRLAYLVRTERPNILHAYLAVPNVLAVLLKVVFPRVKIVWGLRASNVDLAVYDRATRLTYRAERALSRFADLIIVNSSSGKEYYLAYGYPVHTLMMIPNGIDVTAFRSDLGARARVRSEWRVASAERLIGIVGRLDPMKDHSTFFRAVASICETTRKLRFAVIGDGETRYKEEMKKLAETLGIDDSVIWVGGCSDMPAVYSALDILSSSSAFGEGFPNVVGEAMACGVPCVVTDVGDSALIVGNTGIVVPPRDPEALAEGWKVMLERLTNEGKTLSDRARSRVVENFGRELLVERTAQVLAALV